VDKNESQQGKELLAETKSDSKGKMAQDLMSSEGELCALLHCDGQ